MILQQLKLDLGGMNGQRRLHTQTGVEGLRIAEPGGVQGVWHRAMLILDTALHLCLVLAKSFDDVVVGIQHKTTRKGIETGTHDLGDVRQGDVAARHQGPEAHV